MTMRMSSTLRHLDDSGTATLLTLPLSDFSKRSQNNNADDEESGDLILVGLSNSESDGGVTMNDLMSSQNSVYILGDTAESDIAHSSNVPSNNVQQHQEDEGHANQYSSSFEPVAARLIVEPCSVSCDNQAKTLDLVRVETSNTYIVTPPMAKNDDNTHEQESKRQKLSPGGTKKLVTMPARSIGKVPGEDTPSCFFLDPMVLPKGHFANKLRTLLSRWVYNPLEPPSLSGGGESSGALFGYTSRELAHICRSSLAEIEYALSHRVQGAEDALLIPHDANENIEPRYGMLSEEGRQTVSMAIVSTLLESDVDLQWTCQENSDETMELLPLMREVRSNWQREEGAGTILEDEIIWHGLRQIASYTSIGSKNDMPKQVKLIADEVAKMAAHHVFLRGNPQSTSGWKEDEFMEAWTMRLPTMTKSYQPNMKLLVGIAISDTVENGCHWRYFPASGLPFNPSLRIKSMMAFRNAWTLEEAKPYFETLSLNESEVAGLLKRHKK